MATRKATAPAAPAPTDPLDALAQGDPREVITMLLWKNRHHNPELTELITLEDLEKFTACVDYLKVKPEVMIMRAPGAPAFPGNAAKGLPPQSAGPPRPFVVVSIVERGTQNAIRPVENNEDDHRKATATAQRRAARDSAPGMAAALQAGVQTGTYSTDTMLEAARLLMVLASS